VTDLVLGPFLTALAGEELIVEVAVSVPPAGSGSAYVSIEHPASGFALAGAAALARPDGTAAVALTGIAGRPLLLPAGAEPEASLAGIEIVGDRFAPAAYRRQLAAVVVARALERARARAEGRP
jgi:CO/xanthine dehydrogenase FAD-binding subunit